MPDIARTNFSHHAAQQKGGPDLLGNFQAKDASTRHNDDPRLDRVLALREAIRSGCYAVSAEDLAASLTRRGVQITGGLGAGRSR